MLDHKVLEGLSISSSVSFKQTMDPLMHSLLGSGLLSGLQGGDLIFIQDVFCTAFGYVVTLKIPSCYLLSHSLDTC